MMSGYDRAMMAKLLRQQGGQSPMISPGTQPFTGDVVGSGSQGFSSNSYTGKSEDNNSFSNGFMKNGGNTAMNNFEKYLKNMNTTPSASSTMPMSSIMPSASGGLGGSGLIGSASGATPAAANGGASFGLGGNLVGGSGTVGGSTFAAPAASSAGTGAGAGATGGASSLASAGPWAALIAAIVGNESYQKKKGNRSEGSKYWTDLLTGNKIVERDADTLGEKIDPGNKIGLKGDWQVAGDLTSLDFSNAFKGLKDTAGVKLFKNIF